jgi:hypothetical protein
MRWWWKMRAEMLAGTLQGYSLSLDFTPDESMSADGPTLFEAVQRQRGANRI